MEYTMQNRTHTCSELRLSDVGKRVQLSGWMENVREVGGSLAFVILRDFYGTTQLVIETEETFDVALDMEQFTSDATVGDLAGAVLAARFSQ